MPLSSIDSTVKCKWIKCKIDEANNWLMTDWSIGWQIVKENKIAEYFFKQYSHFINLLIYLFVYLIFYSLIYLFVYSIISSFIYLFIYSFINWSV